MEDRMKLKITGMFCLLLITLFSTNIKAQQDTTETVDPFENEEKDYKFDFDFEEPDWDFHSFEGKPAISLNYGFSKMGIDKMATSFAPVNAAEIRLGYFTERKKHNSEYVVKYKYNYFTFSNTSNELTDNTTFKGDVRTKMWQFGFGFEKGYGYKFGCSSILPYYSYGLNWSRLELKDRVRNEADANYIDYFDQSFRFGTMTEGGIRLKPFSNLSLDVAYQREVVMPRLLFWKASASVLIEAIGQWGVDEFIDEVYESSPIAAPIVNFVLKNALSYGIYELRKEKMNWPFETAAPLTYNTFRVGVTFVF